MFTVDVETTVERQIDDVFDYLADMSNSPDYCPPVREIHQVHGDKIELGTIFVSMERPLFFDVRNRYVLTSLKRPYSIQWRFHAKTKLLGITVLKGNGQFLLTADREKTQVHQRNYCYPGLMFRLFQSSFRKMGNQLFNEQFRSLRRILENGSERHPA